MSRLRELFTPKKRKNWKQFCAEMDGKFVRGTGWGAYDFIEIKHNGWTIVITTYKQGKNPAVTLISAKFTNADSFQFRIYKKHIFSNLLKSVTSLQDVVVGHDAFDKSFIIQGNDELKLRQFFDNEHLRELMWLQQGFEIKTEIDPSWLTDPFREGISELAFRVHGVVSELDKLYDIYDLFCVMLDQLVTIGSAYDE